MFSRVVFNQAFGGRIYNGTRIRTGYAPTALFAAYTNSGSGHGTPLYPPATRETCGTPDGDQADRDLTETTIQTGTLTPCRSFRHLYYIGYGIIENLNFFKSSLFGIMPFIQSLIDTPEVPKNFPALLFEINTISFPLSVSLTETLWFLRTGELSPR